MLQIIVGYILILLGVGFLILTVLVWFKVLKPPTGIAISVATWIDILVALINRLPWTATIGILLIYAGIKLIGVNIPF